MIVTIDIVPQALNLVSRGESTAAITLLRQAGEAGSAEALMQLAVWHLLGTVLPHDLAKARALLRRAVSIGHVDGALMEIALTANGSGAKPDWIAARSLLDIAAAGDPVAADLRDLLSAMSIDEQGHPVTALQGDVLSHTPSIICYPRLLTPVECRHIAMVANDMLEPASVIDPGTGKRIAHPIRTSDNMAIGPAKEDLVIRAINIRIAAASGTPVDSGEPLTVLRYRPGQQYRSHLDTIAGAVNQRIATVLVYLNEGFVGGETVFPDAGVTIKPRGGDAIVFTNVLEDHRPDPRSRHAGMPVVQGVKWLATRWIRQAPIDPWTITAAD